jgi:hypothetical protein
MTTNVHADDLIGVVPENTTELGVLSTLSACSIACFGSESVVP